MKNVIFAVVITAALIWMFVATVEASKVSGLEKQIEAHKMAMVFANEAIHTFADPHFEAMK